MNKRDAQGWNIDKARHLYQVDAWGAGFFGVDEQGRLIVHPDSPKGPSVPLPTLVEALERRGLSLPMLVRFPQILQKRLQQLQDVFAKACKEYAYGGDYRTVVPIKVNQQRDVVEALLRFGRPFHVGLEAGSKPELLIALAEMEDPKALIVCNGYKDAEFIETAILARKLGRNAIIVIDRYAEVPMVIAASRKLGIRPMLGARVKLASRGAGRWNESSGDRSKFGLSTGELVSLVARLESENMLDCLQLLHFHIGSQITAIHAIKDAVREASRLYCSLVRMGAQLTYLDVGGGLAVDYDGSHTNFHSSRNYSEQEYANDVVSILGEICKEQEVPHPTIITECGRAVLAHHSVLVFNVLGVNKLDRAEPPEAPKESEHRVIHDLWDAYGRVTRKNFQEAYHDAIQHRDEAITLFRHGVVDLEGRARAEALAYATLFRVLKVTEGLDYVPDDLEALPALLSDMYFCNFSVFQSMPDHWAVNHLFPVMPIHRLDKRPDRRAVIVDLTCDSDGKIDKFIDLRDVRDSLPLHTPGDQPYYLAVFLLGAYQEILGDLHNLFGDTHAMHVEVTKDGYQLRHVVEGDAVTDVLGYVGYNRAELVDRVRRAAENASSEGRISLEETRGLLARYTSSLNGYTYLEDEAVPWQAPNNETP